MGLIVSGWSQMSGALLSALFLLLLVGGENTFAFRSTQSVRRPFIGLKNTTLIGSNDAYTEYGECVQKCIPDDEEDEDNDAITACNCKCISDGGGCDKICEGVDEEECLSYCKQTQKMLGCSSSSDSSSSTEKDVKKCKDRCKKQFSDDAMILQCQGACEEEEGKCPFDNNKKCKDAWDDDDDDEEASSRRNIAWLKKHLRSNEDEKDLYYKMCNAICPKSSLWWVFLIVGLVVVIAVVVVLVLVCFFKKLLCFGASSASVAPAESVSVDTGNSTEMNS